MRRPPTRILHSCLILFAVALISPAHAQRRNPTDTQLFAAIDAEDLAAVKNALAAGASLSAQDKQGRTPLTAAAAQGNAKLLSLLASAGADINAPDRDHQTPLIAAVMHDQIDVIRVLLQLGVDINATDPTGRSAIFYTGDNQEMTALLLSAHPDLALTDRDGRSVLGEQTLSNYRAVFEQLASAGAHFTSATDALYGAAASGNIANINDLLAQGANPNGINGVTVNMTPLMMAAFRGNTAAVRDLLAHGGDPEVADRNKQDALFWACSSKHLDTVEAVLEAQTNLNGSPANFSRTALMTVVRSFDNPGLVHRLLKAGVALDATDLEGQTALMYAAREDRRRDITALLDAGADATLRDKMGKTAADLAHAAHDDALANALDQAATQGPQRKH
jgi:ankyrin repeat protein